jgi:ribonuclease Z
VSLAVTLLGTGGPRPDRERGGTAVLVEAGGAKLLFDAGRGVSRQLLQAGADLPRIGPVFITHHHYDHIGDLHDVILSSWIEGRKGALRIYGPPETRRVVDALLTQVYDKDIEFRDRGEPAIGGWQGVEVVEVVSGLVHEDAGVRVLCEQVRHGDGLDFSDAFRRRWVCLGYRVETRQGVIAISGDTVDCPGLRKLAEGADVLVQCCYLARREIEGEHLRRVARHTLACADTVGRIAAEAKVKTLVLTHHRRKPPEMLDELRRDVAADFPGEIVIGADMTRIEVPAS